MNLQSYLGKLSQAQAHWRDAIAMTPADTASAGASDVALNLHIRFHCEVRGGELIHISTGMIEMATRTMRTLHVMRNSQSDEIVATFVIEVGHMD